MSGSIRIGALLGRNQSFQAVGSWETPANQASIFFNTPAAAHSSGGGLLIALWSGAAGDLARYPLAADWNRYACTDIATHDFDLLFEGHALNNFGSGYIQVGYGGSFITLPFTNNWWGRLQLTGQTLPGSIQIAPVAAVTSLANAAHHLDDFLPMIDPLNLHPEWDSPFNQEVLRDYGAGQDGTAQWFRYGHCFNATLTCRFVPTSHAQIINNWWQTNAPLAVTYGTSDAEHTRLVRLVNPEAPFCENIRPNQGLWSGVLQLSGIAGGGGLEY